MTKRGGKVEFTHPRLIITEGIEDTAFLRALIKSRKIKEFNVYPNIDVGREEGNSAFKSSAIACLAITGFDAVNDILLVADNDGDPKKSFSEICAQIEAARTEGPLTRNWGKMTAVNTKATADPSLGCWLWPEINKVGCLETLLWQCIEKNHAKEAKCVEQALACSGANAWPQNKIDKAKMRCFFSIKCKKNPTVNLSLLWRDCPEIIPLEDKIFDPISDFLSAF